MSEKEKQGFTVSDRRLFTDEGNPRPDAAPAETASAEAAPAEPAPAQPAPAAPDFAPPPTPEEQRASSAAYDTAHGEVDSVLGDALGAQHRPESLKASFDSFIASLYMSTMLQLGLLHERGEQPQVDIVGARHTIDTLAMLEEKTRGNLNEDEKALLQDTLFRLRMAFVEITNALTRPPENAPGR
ncbi:MAG: DUF1844 domain-containing protein [Acidobacteria bacterium]|nr:DUF1844 domain-containing protein [Acidobacteriota bacterium]